MNYKIVVDAGHGGVDPGAVSGGLQEKDFNLRAAQYMAKRFEELGIPVKLTRDSDETLPKSERIRRILNAFGNRRLCLKVKGLGEYLMHLVIGMM